MTRSQKLWGWILGLVPLLGLLGFILGPTYPAGMPDTSGRTHNPRAAISSATPANHGAGASSPVRAPPGDPTVEMQASDLYTLLQTNAASVSKLTFVNGQNEVFVRRVNGADVFVRLPDQGVENMTAAAVKANVVFDALVPPVSTWELIRTFGPVLLTVIAFVVFILMQRGGSGAGGKAGGIMRLGKSKAKDFKALAEGEKPLTFDDIAGCDDAVKHMKRIARWQKYRRIYELFGAKPPRGFLIVGPPGTGKTLLVRVVAHVIDAKIHVTSGSDFDEMLVGVGSSRVRDMFGGAVKDFDETGKTQIIIVDEIDAMAAKRGAHGNNGSEHTLNAMLVELDGVLQSKGVIVIGLTNRPDMLDPALTRAGRLEYHISVDLPDVAGREAIGVIHSRGKRVAKDVTPKWVAKMTYSFSGAQLALVYNHAAILAAERVQIDENIPVDELLKTGITTEIERDDIIKAIDFVQFGDEKTSKQLGMRRQDKINTNVHELGGHALVADVLKDYCDPINKVSMMRHSKTLGFVSFMPDHDRVSWTKEQALAHIIVAMAGRAAQEHFLGVSDSGARGDFQQSTDLARDMVMSWGMSSLGYMSIGVRADGRQINIGPALQDKIDDEVKRITDECYDAAMQIVVAEEARFMILAKVLMEKEVIQADEWRELMKQHPSSFDITTLAMFNKPKKKLEL